MWTPPPTWVARNEVLRLRSGRHPWRAVKRRQAEGDAGALRLPLLVGVGIFSHGLFDFVHYMMIQDAGVPDWWPGFCGSLDVVLGLWVIAFSGSRGGVKPAA